MKIQCSTCTRSDFVGIGQRAPGWSTNRYSSRCPDCRARDRSKLTRVHAFAAGFTAALAFGGLIQDIVGKDAYLKWAADSWIPGKYTVPIEVFVLLCSAVVLLGAFLATWTDREDG